MNSVQFILSSGDFIATISDQSRPTDSTFTICEMQGTPQLRKAARLLTKIWPEALSYRDLREEKEHNPRVFRFLQLKRLGHALNVSEVITLSDGTKISLHGFSEAFTLPMIASSVKDYTKESNSRITSEDGQWIADALLNTISHDSYALGDAKKIRTLILDERHLEPISLSSGHEWHGTHLLFFRGYLIHCNRGGDSTYSRQGKQLSARGITVWKIPNKRKLSLRMIESLIRRHTLSKEQWLKDYHLGPLEEKLSLTYVCHIVQKPQKVGNCTYINTKCAVKALLALKSLMKQFQDAIPDSGDVWEDAFICTELRYKAWVEYDKLMAINDFMCDTNLPNSSVPEEIPHQEIQKIFALIIPEGGQEKRGPQEIEFKRPQKKGKLDETIE